jgi:hypothetical protein
MCSERAFILDVTTLSRLGGLKLCTKNFCIVLLYTNTLIMYSMVTKTLLSIGIAIAIGLSPLRNSSLAKALITITGR